MPEIDAVLTAFLALAGIEDSEKERWRGLCSAALSDLTRHLKEDCDPSLHQDRLTQGAASIAFYQYCLLQSATDCHTLKAGELSLSKDGKASAQAAAAIRQEILSSLQDLVDYSPKILFEVSSC